MTTDSGYQIRAIDEKDIPTWWALARESEPIIRDLTPDIKDFYDGFEEYMQAKIRQGEAYMAWRPGACCVGIVAFSRHYNRITFLGVSEGVAYLDAGTPLIEFALQQLDVSEEITSTVLKGNHPRLAEERGLYERYGFFVGGDTVEAGVPAVMMKRTGIFGS